MKRIEQIQKTRKNWETKAEIKKNEKDKNTEKESCKTPAENDKEKENGEKGVEMDTWGKWRKKEVDAGEKEVPASA